MPDTLFNTDPDFEVSNINLMIALGYTFEGQVYGRVFTAYLAKLHGAENQCSY